MMETKDEELMMKARDSVVKEHFAAILDANEGQVHILSALQVQAETTAHIFYKAGMQEVVEWFSKNECIVAGMTERRVSCYLNEKYQAFLKENGLEKEDSKP